MKCGIWYFASQYLRNTAVCQLCDSWKVPRSFMVHSSGWMTFKFWTEQDREAALTSGPYFVFRIPLLLKVMPSLFQFDDHEIENVLVWITFLCLPLECWNTSCLSHIVSKVGKPLYTDSTTRTKARISYVQVLVEVDESKDLVRSAKLRLPNV